MKVKLSQSIPESARRRNISTQSSAAQLIEPWDKFLHEETLQSALLLSRKYSSKLCQPKSKNGLGRIFLAMRNNIWWMRLQPPKYTGIACVPSEIFPDMGNKNSATVIVLATTVSDSTVM